MQTLRQILPLALLTFAACGSSEDAAGPADTPTTPPAAGQPDQPTQPKPEVAGDVQPGPDAKPTAEGAKVLETMNSGGYTYALLEQKGSKDWFAVSKCEIAVGDRVMLTSQPMRMSNFTADSLQRTFEVIYFAQGMRKVGAGADAPAGDAPTGDAPTGMPGMEKAMVEQAHSFAREKNPAATVEAGTVAVAEGGVTVAEIWAKGKELVGQEVSVRGKVVKFNAQILGRNWLHLRDGTGAEGTNDITITTDATAKVGDTVLVVGKLGADADFGSGYTYALIIEEAKVTVE